MDPLSTVISLFALLFAVTVHEASHAWSALKFGDPTAAAMGRISLNPLAHIDPIGSVILPLVLVVMKSPFLFGWAKPVMVNPRNLRHPRQDNLWISFAGPAANLATAAASLLLLLVVKAVRPGAISFLAAFLQKEQRFPAGFYPVEGLVLILFYFILVNILLAVFNLIPVPPLDGSGVLAGLLSYKAAAAYDKIRPYGFIIVLALIWLGVLDVIARPAFAVIGRLIFSS
ncbi:MAG TPA: site-2 protease family protein [Acidobacteriota bacterium]|nr:site-2 protease family protein [Acidobacteriota bacterium]